MAYEGFKDLTRRTASDKILRDKAFNIPKNPKYVGYQRGFASMVYEFFDNGIKMRIFQNKVLAEELHKPIIKRFKKRKVHSSFIDNVWDTGLADMQLIS